MLSSDAGLSFTIHNRNKKSVTLNLQTPEGKALFAALVRHFDVFLENLSPGAVKKLSVMAIVDDQAAANLDTDELSRVLSAAAQLDTVIERFRVAGQAVGAIG